MEFMQVFILLRIIVLCVANDNVRIVNERHARPS